MYIFGVTNVGGPGAIIAVPSPRDKRAYCFETISGLPGKRGNSIMEFFIIKSPCATWFKKAEVVEKSYAIVDLFTSITSPYHEDVLVVGDAAAYAECLYPAVTDEMDEGVYVYTNLLMDYFSGLPGVPKDLIVKMNSIKACVMGDLDAVVSKIL